jgi:hypothetical protein
MYWSHIEATEPTRKPRAQGKIALPNQNRFRQNGRKHSTRRDKSCRGCGHSDFDSTSLQQLRKRCLSIALLADTAALIAKWRIRDYEIKSYSLAQSLQSKLPPIH